jgi:hypothetical protein
MGRVRGVMGRPKKHGHRLQGFKSLTYTSWEAMKRRCLAVTADRYKDYGGRGITIEDPRWMEFTNFLADMGERPSRDHSLDRIDNDGGYCKENCRWTLSETQAANRRYRHG